MPLVNLSPGQLRPRDHLSDLVAVDVLSHCAMNCCKPVPVDPVVRTERCAVAQGRSNDGNGCRDHRGYTEEIQQYPIGASSGAILGEVLLGRRHRTPPIFAAPSHCDTSGRG